MYVLIQSFPTTGKVICLGVYKKSIQAVGDAIIETNRYVDKSKLDLSKIRFSTAYTDESKDDSRLNRYMDAYYDDDLLINYWLLFVSSDVVGL